MGVVQKNPNPNLRRPLVIQERMPFQDKQLPSKLIVKSISLEIDLGVEECVFDDGRPAVIEE
jgi:hypothetical protein